MSADGRMYNYYKSQQNIKSEGGPATAPCVGTAQQLQLSTTNVVLNPSPNTAFTPMAGATKTATKPQPQRRSSVLTTKDAAVRFKQNWLAHNPPELHSDSSNGSTDSNLDDSLTSLNWLQNLRIMKIQQPTPPSSPTPLSPMNRDTTFTIQNKSRQNSTPTTCEEAKALLRTASIPVQPACYQTVEQVDYKNNEYVKPPYSYATLIWMAMKDSKRNKITLSAIYKWITDNFKYYQVADPSWQNSIRHNLSLNKCFQKVPRKKDEPGKGGFWRIDPAHADLLENGIYKKRRNTAPLFGSMDFLPKRIKVEPMDDGYDDVFEDDINNNLLKSHCRKQTTPRKHSMPEFTSDSRKRRLQLQGKRDPLLEDSTLPSHILKEDYTWNNIFNSEIEVEGMRIKTEDILNEYYGDVRAESPLIPISPPPSEANDDNNICPERVDLDLSINGKQIPRPEWFEEQLKGLELSGDLPDMPEEEDFESLFGHFDFPPSPACSLHGGDDQAHPWAEKGRELMLSESFGVEDLFDYTSMPVTAMPNWENGPLPSP